MFLSSTFHVGKYQNLEFYLDILSLMSMKEHGALDLSLGQRVLDLYITMGAYASRVLDANERIR